MAVASRISIMVRALESQSRDLGLATMPHLVEYPTPAVNSGSPEFATGTASYQFDRVWSDQRTLTATSEDLDLAGVLTSQLDGSTITFVEIGGILIYNTSTTAALTVGGAAANQAFTGLFAAATERLKVGPLGQVAWVSPIDGGGLTVVAGTADQLKIDAGAATITYQIVLLGRSA
jgi:hypothetical protein